MKLSTTYLGLKLANPIMPGASPMSDNLDMVRRLEDAGASAIVMHSLFEEQIVKDAQAVARHIERWTESFSEAADFFPSQEDYAVGPDQYLEQIGRIKMAVKVPVVASLNGIHPGGWVEYARLIQQAGADALELNTYFLATSRTVRSAELEERVIEIVRTIRQQSKLPLAVKLSPYYTSLGSLVGLLEGEGADGVVMFNRFFQPEIDLETLEVVPKLDLSTSEDLRLRLRWLGLLRTQTSLSLACSGGVHTPADVVKAILAGADVVQCVAALLRRGPERLKELLDGLRVWMEEHEYASVDELRGALSVGRAPDPEAFERGNYLRTLQLWRE